jgi:hypothetical protein
MAQRENLEVQGCTGTDDTAERRQKSHQDRRHGEPSLSFDAGKFNRVSACDVFGRHSRADDAVLGVAARETGYAFILTPRVIDFADYYFTNRAELLGRVLAHEVGHLVLPVHSHSTTGIMRADLDVRATLPGFTPEQGDTIRMLVAADI